MTRQNDLRRQALKTLQDLEVLMRDGHFDYGNGFHGRVYLNPHQLFLHPSTIWRLAQDLLDVFPAEILAETDVVAGTCNRRRTARTHDRRAARWPARADAPGRAALRPSPNAARRIQCSGVSTAAAWPASACCSQTMCGTRARRCSDAPSSSTEAGGRVIATVEIFDRMEAIVDLGVPNFALAEYAAPENYEAAQCPMCRDGLPITTF